MQPLTLRAKSNDLDVSDWSGYFISQTADNWKLWASEPGQISIVYVYVDVLTNPFDLLKNIHSNEK